MASNYTGNYGLCQWEATDSFVRTEFNQDNARIDAALKDLEDTKELEPVTTHAGGESGGLYGDLTGYSAAQREEAPARHLDFKDLEHHFGKDYEIK